ncbi:hypothetical protein AIOL_004801 [Candidatus Rhodobacter oscarellae]|uniref:NADH:ubiquinone oxidoreductase intermediate-associated protein 30 domain-containing protein n=1 Tax=Candidatus Rhodobacter oscarellae TaxID=1675527 RepID=A0A0J9EAK0_9RHOB|nr:CIA30 family protein [Candidatus Rhodobacter lobularis]KMW59817.1 hypothetical protein AIOL_004801 [Candidatus Rhodobacter lobularis]
MMHPIFPAALSLALGAAPILAAAEVFEDFTGSGPAAWEYIADGVMGGVSKGEARVLSEGPERAIHLTGTVSTENNGGFIQVRRLLPDGLPEGTKGLRLSVRGNGEAYYVFLRTKEMMRPWYYYNVAFTAPEGWETVEIPLAALTRSHAHLAELVDPAEAISIGLVAYGRDHAADLMVREITLY